MKITHARRLAAVAGVGVLALAACGTDNNDTTGTAGKSPNDSRPAAERAKLDVACASGTVNASGSTAQANAMDAWIKAYQGACPDATINYQANGSGAGVQQFIQGSTAFAGSDVALRPDEQPRADARCSGGEAVNVPMVTGPIAIAYNLPGVDGLQLSPDTIAGIFSGTIDRWNDPAIAHDNPKASLPSTTIQSVHRSDDSGTSANFTGFLRAAAPDAWPFDPGKHWTAPGGQGASGSAGVAQLVKQTPGTVAYVEYSYALGFDLAMAEVANGSGEFVELTPASASKAVAAADVTDTGPGVILDIDYATKAPGAYPIILVTYEITCTEGLTPDQRDLVRSFLSYAASDAGQRAIADPELGYAPLPDEISARAREAIEGPSSR